MYFDNIYAKNNVGKDFLTFSILFVTIKLQYLYILICVLCKYIAYIIFFGIIIALESLMKKFVVWLNNATIRKKFLPLQWVVIVNVIIICLFSFLSIALVNYSSQNIINTNVRHKEELSAIIRNMYVCRVLGRDILFAVDEDVKNDYYDDYINAFDELDQKMDAYSKHLSGTQLVEFTRIIEEKNEYKRSMILSADIWIGGGSYDDALHALQVVTPIANEFFGSIDEFSNEEEKIMNEALEVNDGLVITILISGLIVGVAIIVGVVLFIRFFSKSMSTSLIKLEKSMSQIAETGNMKIEIPEELYTKDEIGLIASVANKMKTMLLEYSFNDTLTGGYNAKAYHEEINELFSEEDTQKELWCIIADMNNLKLINDNLGHVEGDNALRNSYYALNGNFGIYGKTFRIGGDEFVSLLSNCTKKEVDLMIIEIETQIAKANKNSVYKYSLAIGVDHFVGKSAKEYNEFFKLVDQKMYDNKIASKQSRMSSRVTHPPDKA